MNKDINRDEGSFNAAKQRALELVRGVQAFLLEVDGDIDQNLKLQFDAVLKSIEEIQYNPAALSAMSEPDIPGKKSWPILVEDRRIRATLEEAFPPGSKFGPACRRYFLWQSNRLLSEMRLFHEHVKKNFPM